MGTHPFDDYLAKQPEPQRSTLLAMAAALRTLLPGAQERMSYGMPAFQCDGTSIAGIAGFKRHCSYFPHSGAVVPLVADAFAGYDVDDGTVRMPIDKPLPTTLLRLLVTTRLRLESQHAPRGNTLRSFYDNGRLESKGPVRNGQRHGTWTFYRRDGSPLRSGNFHLDQPTGLWRTFDRDGHVVKEARRS